ncbi:hypothetical protein CVH10_07985 [Halomonas sp. ND22Bw]|uniref:Uncharacterized protein n=1 Tax=Halomonas salina TaxID=42565 RepID=A0ABR4WVT1_9GAMM|nr:hypothetical protein [Halomonas salina]KGE78839.1 hypothetical protein FP66_00690 [Halomonas salina]PSJ22435.1 hypothetical protein CVH10_07985 [Halomonas sp. ND22Bw]
MPFTEAKEHAPGCLHRIFAEPYAAFDNGVPERQLHLRIALQALLEAPMREGRLTLRVIHGWENGGCAPEDLRHGDHALGMTADLRAIAERYQQALDRLAPLPGEADSLLAEPLAGAIASAEADGLEVDSETRDNPARWPAFPRGLSLYTFFKVYHRLTYGEDEAYRSIRCNTPEGSREIHEFHLEEGEFAIVRPADDEPGECVLVLHVGQLEPLSELLEMAHIRP